MADAPPPTRRTEPIWLEPYPDVLLEEIPDRSPSLTARYEARESIELAFHRCPPGPTAPPARHSCCATCSASAPPGSPRWSTPARPRSTAPCSAPGRRCATGLPGCVVRTRFRSRPPAAAARPARPGVSRPRSDRRAVAAPRSDVRAVGPSRVGSRPARSARGPVGPPRLGSRPARSARRLLGSPRAASPRPRSARRTRPALRGVAEAR